MNGLKRPHGPLNFSLPHPGRHPSAYPQQHYKVTFDFQPRFLSSEAIEGDFEFGFPILKSHPKCISVLLSKFKPCLIFSAEVEEDFWNANKTPFKCTFIENRLTFLKHSHNCSLENKGGAPPSSHSPRSSGLYRPYESSPSPAVARSSQPVHPSHRVRVNIKILQFRLVLYETNLC